MTEQQLISIFDTHTHLNANQFAGIETEIISQAKKSGVDYMAVVGFDQETIIKSLELAERYPNLISVIGWHPTESYRYNSEIEAFIIEKLDHEKVYMYGEIGLDYHWETSTKKEQWKAFRRQIAIAKEFNLPITIHNRDATADVYRILKEEGLPQSGGIMHSFGGSVEEAQQFLDLGMYISFSGVVTFKNSEKVRQAAKLIPNNRLLVETDAPYLAPVPKRGKRNEPAYTRYIVETLAEVRNTSIEEIARVTRENAFKLFDWYPKEGS